MFTNLESKFDINLIHLNWILYQFISKALIQLHMFYLVKLLGFLSWAESSLFYIIYTHISWTRLLYGLSVS